MIPLSVLSIRPTQTSPNNTVWSIYKSDHTNVIGANKRWGWKLEGRREGGWLMFHAKSAENAMSGWMQVSKSQVLD